MALVRRVLGLAVIERSATGLLCRRLAGRAAWPRLGIRPGIAARPGATVCRAHA